jgi:hypothetical protein
MAHYAKLDENNIVQQIIVVDNEKEMKNGIEDEMTGIAFCTDLTGHTNWKKTSYNNNIRKRYAAIGYRYNQEKDEFIAPQPFPSWTLDDNSDWQPPTPKPQDGNLYFWDESALSWQLVPLPESSSDNGA